MELIDSHCHLASFHRKGILDETLKHAAEAGVSGLVTIGTCDEDWSLYRDLAATRPGALAYTVGLHPGDVDVGWEQQLAQLAGFLDAEPRPVAIGEVGLDHFRLPQDPSEAEKVKARQREAFKLQLALATRYNLPVVIHSRGAFHHCVETIDQCGTDWSKVVFHCFSGGPDEIRMLNERGGRGSFTGIVTYKNAPNVREAALSQGLDKFMVETDAPYLAPVPKRGKPNEPAYLRHTAEFCAGLFGVDLAALSKHSVRNTRDFFGL